jgi:hypothetical protein
MAWQYNDTLQVITHNDPTCDPCAKWGNHYMKSIMFHDASMTQARERRETHAREKFAPDIALLREQTASLLKTNEALTENNDSLRKELHALRKDLQCTRENYQHERSLRDRAEHDSRRLSDDYKALEQRAEEEITNLRQQIHITGTEPHRKRARHSPRSRSSSRSRRVSSSIPLPDSPMLEDHNADPPQDEAAPPYLLTRMTSAQASPASPPITDASPIITAEPSSIIRQAALSQPRTHPTFAPTPIAPYVNFPSLLPVIFYGPGRRLTSAPGTARLDADGNIDTQAHPYFVLAMGSTTADNQPAWNTTLLKAGRLQTEQARQAIRECLLIPLLGVVSGGSNGVLISPMDDPKTDKELDKLFLSPTPKQHRFACGYIDRIRFTPPELRNDFHSNALERWEELQTERRSTGTAHNGKRSEPAPSMSVSIWKRWLKEAREQSKDKQLRHPGIPFVGSGYQTIHIEGARALLSFLPLTAKRAHMCGGSFRDGFLWAAAALLCIPGRYTQALSDLGQTIAHERSASTYDEAQFGAAASLSINQIGHFLASVGVTSEEAEKWRPWAAAYVEMELEARPDAGYAQALRHAKDLARARITNNPALVLTRINPNSPGHWTPEGNQPQIEAQQETQQPEAGPSSITADPPSAPTELSVTTRENLEDGDSHMPYAPSGAAGEEEPSPGYGDDLDEDTRMGPG